MSVKENVNLQEALEYIILLIIFVYLCLCRGLCDLILQNNETTFHDTNLMGTLTLQKQYQDGRRACCD